MRILVTRPEPDALKLKARLETLDHDVTVEPLLSVDFDDADPIELDDVQAIIATSQNGLRALKQQRVQGAAAKLPLFAVGPATAREARNLGFELIVAGPGGARDLALKIVSTLDPQSGLLLHLAGDKLAFDLETELQHHGFRLLQPTVYRMVARRTLSESTIDHLKVGAIDAILLLSPRTADTWVNLVRAHGLLPEAQRLLYVCLSPAIAARLKPLAPVRTETAASPTLEDLLALIT